MSDRSVTFFLHRETQDDGSEGVVSVTLSHHDKRYTVGVNRERHQVYHGVKFRTCNLLAGKYLRVEDAPRFSQKRLDALAGTILDDARVRALVEQARTLPLP